MWGLLRLDGYARILDRVGELGRGACESPGDTEPLKVLCSHLYRLQAALEHLRSCEENNVAEVREGYRWARLLGAQDGDFEVGDTHEGSDLRPPKGGWLSLAKPAPFPISVRERMAERLGLLNKLLGEAAKTGWPTWYTGGAVEWCSKLGTVDFLTSAIQSCAVIDKGRGLPKRDLDNES